MQQVSETFAPYADMRVCDMRVVFNLVDVDAASTAIPDCSDSCTLTQLEQTHDGLRKSQRNMPPLKVIFGGRTVRSRCRRRT